MLFVKLFTCDLLPLNSFASVDMQEVGFCFCRTIDL